MARAMRLRAPRRGTYTLHTVVSRRKLRLLYIRLGDKRERGVFVTNSVNSSLYGLLYGMAHAVRLACFLCGSDWRACGGAREEFCKNSVRLRVYS